jgi:hypothetical protein
LGLKDILYKRIIYTNKMNPEFGSADEFKDFVKETRKMLNSEVKKFNNLNYYNKREKMMCNKCNIEIDKYYFKIHCSTKKHQANFVNSMVNLPNQN